MKMEMTDLIKGQILLVRETGLTNMVDVRRVKQIGAEHGYKEMISYIENNLDGYINFIAYGDETGIQYSRNLADFNEKEKRALLIKSSRLVKHLLNLIDGTGDPYENANNFDVELDNMVFDYHNWRKAKR